LSDVSPLGTHLSHYKIIKLLNQGGMGQIYLAEDQRLHRTVAIKTIKSALATTHSVSNDNAYDDDCDAKVIENALLEAQLLAKLNHANIVQIYDITQEKEQICLVMEYLGGKTLHHYQQEQVSSLSQKLAIISQISKGLTAAHAQGIVHCDLKPSNIIIDDNGGVKIVDFGIAKLTSGNADTANNSQSFGSQTAMSPEQLYQALASTSANAINDQTNNAINFRSDLFSLGIIAFQLISGRHPFAGVTATQTAQNILNAQCQQAQDIVPQLPRELINLLNKLLSHQPEGRPQSSQWVTQQFEQITKHQTQQEILAEDTLPITAELSTEFAALTANEFSTNVLSTSELAANKLATNPTTTDNVAINQHKSRRFIFAAFALLASLLVGVGIFSETLFAPADLPTRYIVVLPATITNSNAESPIADMQKDLVTATLDDAIRQSIINTKGLRLISRREVAGVSKSSAGETASIANIAAATGASDIITTQLDCNNVKCDVTLSRLTVKNNSNNNANNKNNTNKWTVLAQKKWPSQIENYYEIYQHSKANLTSIFSNYNDNVLTEQPIKPADYQNYVMLYNQVMIAGSSSEATLEQLQKTITSSPYLYAAYSLYRENTLNLYNETNESKYIKQIENIIALAPAEYKTSVFQALDVFAIAMSTGDFDKAKKQLDIAIKRGIDDSTLMEYQAALLLNNNEIEQAVEQYKIALTLRPSTKLLYNVALSYYWLSDFTNAKQSLQRLLNITPAKYNAKQLLADIYLSEGELNSSIGLYEEITKISSESSDIDNLGLAYTLAGRYHDSLKMAELSVARSPEHPSAILNLADIKLILGLTEQATSLYQQVIKLSDQQQDLETLIIIAQAYVHLDQGKPAIKAINQAKKLAPENGQVAFIAALVYNQLSEQVSAMNQVEEALAAGFGLVWFNLPWFDSLCDNSDFQQLLIKAGKFNRCQR
jgi:serine/threonine protein kinase/Tfp pilus assembly protein PilF